MSSGTLTSITNLATSLARNMDRLSLDEEHYNRQEEWRRQLPESLGEGLRLGLSRLGISLLGKECGDVRSRLPSGSAMGQELPGRDGWEVHILSVDHQRLREDMALIPAGPTFQHQGEVSIGHPV